MSDKEEKEEKQPSVSPQRSTLVFRDLAEVAALLRESAPTINAEVRRLEKSQQITQEILDLQFTI